jgi:chemotaxis protein histidine kinase CheA
MSPVDPLLEGLVKGFLVESQEQGQKITRDLLELERAQEGGQGLAKTYENLARGLHTLKGSAATLGLDDLSNLAHKMEDVVAPIRKALIPFPAQSADLLLTAMDAFVNRLKAHAEGKGETLPEPGKLIEVLVSHAEANKALAAGSVPAEAKPAEAAANPAAQAAPKDAATPAQGAEGNDEQSSWRVGTRQVVGLMREVERLREVRLRLDERRRDVDRALALLAKLGILAETAETRALLMAVNRAIAADGEETADIVDALEDGVKAICTLPVRTLLDPMHRSVRDLCRTTGKEAKLSVVGAEVSLDRRVLEVLKGPLVHLVRNAIDHGIERPEVRIKRGKHREGALVIRVEQQGNVVFLEIADDGGGLDPERIREVARERKVVATAELEKMESAQLFQLIFRSGFSTSREITETSGRGVGLDVVRNQVEQLRGHVEVVSTPGQGARFILTLPADLGSSPVLVVRVGEHHFGLPMLSVENIVGARRDHLQIGRTQMKFQYRDQLLPLQDLGALMALRQPEVPQDGRPVMMIQAQGHSIALTVDEIVGDRDLVIRPLPHEVRDVAAYQGASTMARGELLMILRADWLVNLERRVDAPLTATRRALVVDDSLTARALHRAMLEAGGYTVHAVSNARQALNQLKHAAYDVVVCDIGMDEMDGFDFTSAVRAEPEIRAVPVILVSARDSAGDKEQGVAVGADGFLSKKDCASGRLLAEVSAVISRRRGG